MKRLGVQQVLGHVRLLQVKNKITKKAAFFFKKRKCGICEADERVKRIGMQRVHEAFSY